MKINVIGMILDNAGRHSFDAAVLDDNGRPMPAADSLHAMIMEYAKVFNGGTSDLVTLSREVLAKPEEQQPAVAQGAGEVVTLQQRVHPWLMACFGPEIAADRQERNHRFLEEALELVQACGCTASEAHQLVDYTFGRPLGEKNQEVGGVMITLAALCLANGLDMHAAGETELARIWTMVEKIRAKQAAKPKHSPLPQHVDTQPAAGADVPDMVEIMALADRYRYATDGKDATDVRELLRAEIAASGRQE